MDLQVHHEYLLRIKDKYRVCHWLLSSSVIPTYLLDHFNVYYSIPVMPSI